MTLRLETLSEAITAEITRVSSKRERDLAAARGAGAMGETRTSLYLMDQVMHFAVKARDRGSPAAMAMALTALRDIR